MPNRQQRRHPHQNHPALDLPPGVGAALLDKNNQGPQVVNPGDELAVFANDVTFNATANEVVITFACRWGGGSHDDPPVVQEVARVAMTWAGFDVLTESVNRVSVQTMEFRTKAAEEMTQMLRQRFDALRQMAQNAAPGAES